MSSCLPRDEYCKASHTRDAVRAAHWCGVGVVAGAVVRTLHLMFSRFSALYLSEQGRAQEFFSPNVKLRWYTQIPCQLNPYQTMQKITFRDMAAHWATFRYITFRDTTWHCLTMTTHRMSLDRITLITHIRDPTCMHACRRHFLIYIITVWVHLTYNIIHRVT